MSSSPKTADSKSSDSSDLITTAAPIAQVIQINASNSLPLKLTPNNFPSWYLQIDTLLSGLDLKGFVDGTLPSPLPTIEGTSTANPDFLKWSRQDKLVLHAIIASLTEAIIPIIS